MSEARVQPDAPEVVPDEQEKTRVTLQIPTRLTLDQVAEMLVHSLSPQDLAEVVVRADELIGNWGFTLSLGANLLEQLYEFAVEDQDGELQNHLYLLIGRIKREAKIHS